MDAKLVIAAAIVALLMLVGHWFKWPRTLPRLVAYVYGCSGVLVGVYIWRADLFWPVFVLFAAAGGATVFAYAWDGGLTRVADWRAERKASRGRVKS